MTTTRTAAVTAAIAALVSALLTYFTTKHLTRRRDQIAFVVRQPKKTAACMPRNQECSVMRLLFRNNLAGLGECYPVSPRASLELVSPPGGGKPSDWTRRSAQHAPQQT
jgi:hypothetical protein